MDKEKLVDNLIANKATKWVEEDRAVLMEMDEKILDNMAPNEVAPEELKEGEPDAKLEAKPEEFRLFARRTCVAGSSFW